MYSGKIYVSVDSGGTKVRVIAYGEDYKPLGTVLAGSVRLNSTPQTVARENCRIICDFLMQFFEKTGEKPCISRLSGCVPDILLKYIAKRFRIASKRIVGEYRTAADACPVFGDCRVILCGTGATVFLGKGDTMYNVGGYGSNVSDEGSGYWMGRSALTAAIRCNEGRGEKTVLPELVCEKFGEPDFRKAVFSIYENKSRSPVSGVASCAKLLDKGAEMGDRVCEDILRKAGSLLADQAVSSLKMYANEEPEQLPIVIAGSVWKGNSLIFNTFYREFSEKYPDRPVRIPEFEPVIGPILRHYYETNGNFTKKDLNFFKKAYKSFIYDWPDDRSVKKGQ